MTQSFEEIERCEKNSLLILRVTDLNLACINKVVDVRKKRPDCDVIVCCEGLNGEYQLLLNELGIRYRTRRATVCECCLEEMDFERLVMRVIRSAFGRPIEADPLLRKVAVVVTNGLPELRLKSIANTINISPDHLSRVLKKKTGLGFRDFAKELKFRIAEEMIFRRIQTIEIAESLGYTEKANFYRFFRNMAGMNPNRYVETTKGLKSGWQLPPRPITHCSPFGN